MFCMFFTCVWQVDPTDKGRDLLEHLRAAEPSSVKDRASFVERMGSLYDASFPASVPAVPVSPEGVTPAPFSGTP